MDPYILLDDELKYVFEDIRQVSFAFYVTENLHLKGSDLEMIYWSSISHFHGQFTLKKIKQFGLESYITLEFKIH